MLARAVILMLLMTHHCSGLSVRHPPGMLSVRSSRLYAANSLCLSAAKRAKSTTINEDDVKDALSTDKSDEKEEWIDESEWTDDFNPDGPIMFADDAEQEILEEDD